MSASLIGRLGSSAFRLSNQYSVGVARGLVLLYGIGTRALPSWDSRTRRINLWVGLAVRGTARVILYEAAQILLVRTRRTMSSGSTSAARPGWLSTSSLMRASNFSFPTIPTLRPKLRKVPRRSFSMASTSTAAACDASATCAASGCVTSSHAPTVKPRPHHLCHAARIIAIGLVDLRLEHRPHVPRLDTDHRQARFRDNAEQPLR